MQIVVIVTVLFSTCVPCMRLDELFKLKITEFLRNQRIFKFQGQKWLQSFHCSLPGQSEVFVLLILVKSSKPLEKNQTGLLHVFAYKYMYMVLLELSAKTACQVLRSSNSRLYWRFSYKNKYIQQLFVTLKLYYFEHAWYK